MSKAIKKKEDQDIKQSIPVKEEKSPVIAGKEKPIKKDPKKVTKKKKVKKKKPIAKIKVEEKKDPPLSHNQIMFCEEYIKTQNAKQSYLKVYSKCKPESAESSSIRLLGSDKIKAYIEERLKPIKDQEKEEEKKAIADADEILETFTKILRGEIKDQLGLDASLKDRISAGKELGKRYGLFKDPESDDPSNKPMPTVNINVIDNSHLEKDLYEQK